MTQKEKEQRAVWRAAGKCWLCGRPRMQGRTRCRKHVEYSRAYEHTPKRKAYIGASNRAFKHARRARVSSYGGSWTPEQFAALCAHFNNLCLCCGQEATPGNPLSADHIVPVSWAKKIMLPLGFLNDIDNIQPLLQNCNASKFTSIVDYRANPHPNCLTR